MSYFGTSGPAQDGGFIGGIQRGSDRLHNARVTRARAGNMDGVVSDALPQSGTQMVIYLGAAYLMYRLYIGNRRRARAPAQSPLYAIWS